MCTFIFWHYCFHYLRVCQEYGLECVCNVKVKTVQLYKVMSGFDIQKYKSSTQLVKPWTYWKLFVMLDIYFALHLKVCCKFNWSVFICKVKVNIILCTYMYLFMVSLRHLWIFLLLRNSKTIGCLTLFSARCLLSPFPISIVYSIHFNINTQIFLDNYKVVGYQFLSVIQSNL